MPRRKKNLLDILKKQRLYATEEAIEETRLTGEDLKLKHREVVRDWRHKPGFRVQSYRRPNVYSVKIVPTGRYAKIWGYVDRGTKPHVIAAVNAPTLHFQMGYSARTAPVAKFNQGTGTASGAWVQKKEVQHPGTAARKFTETFVEELDPPFPDRIQAAIQRGITRANR